MRFSFVIILSAWCMMLQAQANPEMADDCQTQLDTVHVYCRGSMVHLLQVICIFMRDIQDVTGMDEITMNHHKVRGREPFPYPFVDTKDCCRRHCTLPEMYEYC